ncbi:MAG: endo-1,4-beta-xylanase [Planctomycetaceae bacterium]
MRFLVHPPEMLDGWPEAYRAYISGADGRVFPTQVEIIDNVLTCRRTTSESGKLHVAIPIASFGRPVVSTGSLSEREEPYLLSVELARGQISQLRDQLGQWELAGLTAPEEFKSIHRQAYKHFLQAVANQNPRESAELATSALVAAFEASELLARAYSEQRLRFRSNRSTQLPASLGCTLGGTVPDAQWEQIYCQAFNAAIVPIQWRDIEPAEGEYHWENNDAQVKWCHDHKLLMYGGPLLDLAPEGLPAWVWQWERDFLNLQSFVCDFVETAISRYLGKIRNWEISARVNTGGALTIGEQDRLALVARTLEAARQVNDEIQLMIRVDQPWGGYQARGQHHLSPIQFVDALWRAGVGLSGVNLEIAVGYRPRGSGSRGLLAFSRLIDRWSVLGVPLFVTLAFPSESGPDSKSRTDLEVDNQCWQKPSSEEAQAEWIDSYLPILMSKEAIVGIYWAHFSDRDPHDFPHAGLIRPDGTAKPGLEHIIKYRREYWQAG